MTEQDFCWAAADGINQHFSRWKKLKVIAWLKYGSHAIWQQSVLFIVVILLLLGRVSENISLGLSVFVWHTHFSCWFGQKCEEQTKDKKSGLRHRADRVVEGKCSKVSAGWSSVFAYQRLFGKMHVFVCVCVCAFVHFHADIKETSNWRFFWTPLFGNRIQAQGNMSNTQLPPWVTAIQVTVILQASDFFHLLTDADGNGNVYRPTWKSSRLLSPFLCHGHALIDSDARMVCSCETEHVSGRVRPGGAGSLVVQLDRRGCCVDGAGEGLTTSPQQMITWQCRSVNIPIHCVDLQFHLYLRRSLIVKWAHAWSGSEVQHEA